MKLQSIVALSICLSAAVVLQGCATPQSPPVFPEAHSAAPVGGTFVNVENLRQVGPGLTKDQLYDLLGPPHFNEWFVGGHVWNYLFDFRRDSGVVACQYQVQFDQHMRVAGTYWRDPACADFLRTAADARPLPVESRVTTIERFTLRSDTLFAFGKSSLDAMSPVGRASLDETVRHIKGHTEVTEVTIVGHTDRIGSASVNQPLSVARAESVRAYLISHGVNGSAIHTEGVGSADPVSHCPAGVSGAVIACLEPDRRVSITVEGRS